MSKMCNRSKPLDALKPLLFLAKWLAIVPNLYGKDKQYVPRYYYSSIIIMFFVSVYCYSSYGKIFYMATEWVVTVQFIEFCCDACLLITNICSISIGLMKGKAIFNFHRCFEKIDAEFKDVNKNKKSKFFCELVAAHIFYVAYVSYDLYIWLNSVGFQIYQFFMLRAFQVYHVLIISLLLRHYALSIKDRFEILNGILRDFPRGNQIVTLLDLREGPKQFYLKNEWDIKRIRRIFTTLVSMVDEYNFIFGWQYVVLYIYIVVNLLNPVNIALVYGSGEQKIAGNAFGAELIILCVIWAALPLVIATGIFSAGDEGTSEISKTPSICYCLVQDLSSSSKDLDLKAELQSFAQQASINCKEYTAAGFFIVNFQMLFVLVGSISTYLIVLIQFK